MRKVRLKCRFNNPNSLEDTIEMLFKFFIEVNMPRIEEIIKTFMDSNEKNSHPE